MSRWLEALPGAALPWRRLAYAGPRRHAAHAMLLCAAAAGHCAPGAAATRPAEPWPQWCAAHPGAAVHLVVAGSLAHSWALVNADLPLASRAELTAYARHQFQHFHGPAAAAWPLAVWAQGRCHAACALHGIDLQQLHAQARAHDVLVLSLQPWWSVALRVACRIRPQWARRPRQALVLVDASVATWVLCHQGAVQSVSQRRLGAAAGEDLLQHLQAWRAQDGVDADSMLLLGCALNGGLATAFAAQPGAQRGAQQGSLPAAGADSWPAAQWVQG